MPRFVFQEGNQFYRYFRFNEFEFAEETATTLTLEISGDYDPRKSPFRIEFVFEDAVSTPNEGGPSTYTAGTITGINFYNDSDDLLLEVTELDLALSEFSDRLAADDLRDYYYDSVVATDTVFVGSNDASGPQDSETGDSIRTGEADDIVRAKGGNDLIKDLGGFDIYKGGAGVDCLDFSAWDPEDIVNGVKVNLIKGRALGPDAITDEIKSIENVIGTTSDDRFSGNDKDNTYYGLAGDDTLIGRVGSDTASYTKDARHGGNDGITADMVANTVVDGFGDTDTLKSIERVEGTGKSDLFIDGAGNNAYFGRGDADEFRFIGGDNYVEGGSGADTFVMLDGATGETTIRDFVQGTDMMEVEGLTDFGDLSIRQSGSGINAIIEYEDFTIILREFDSTLLTASDFGL